MADTRRYWDGRSWTEHRAPATDPRAYAHTAAAAEPDHRGLIRAGFITAILVPFIGFIIGIVLIAKGKVGPGIGCLILSVVAFMFWADHFTQDPGTTTNYYGSLAAVALR